MPCGKKHKYGNAGQVKVHFADGGAVRKNPLPPPPIAKVKSPILEKAKEGPGPGGPGTPGAKGTYPMPKKRKGK